MEDLYGNGECDSVFNYPECGYDGGDCDPDGTSTTEADPGACVIPDGIPESWLGDNYCDEALNNEMCDFDGGDCAGSSIGNTQAPASVDVMDPQSPPSKLHSGTSRLISQTPSPIQLSI